MFGQRKCVRCGEDEYAEIHHPLIRTMVLLAHKFEPADQSLTADDQVLLKDNGSEPTPRR